MDDSACLQFIIFSPTVTVYSGASEDLYELISIQIQNKIHQRIPGICILEPIKCNEFLHVGGERWS